MSYGTETNNHHLLKPSQDDFYDIDVANDNMDIIDAGLINYGTAEPTGRSYIWHKTLRSRLIGGSIDHLLLELAPEAASGYHLKTGAGREQIVNEAVKIVEV